jgi:hypothetical protein
MTVSGMLQRSKGDVCVCAAGAAVLCWGIATATCLLSELLWVAELVASLSSSAPHRASVWHVVCVILLLATKKCYVTPMSCAPGSRKVVAPSHSQLHNSLGRYTPLIQVMAALEPQALAQLQQQVSAPFGHQCVDSGCNQGVQRDQKQAVVAGSWAQSGVRVLRVCGQGRGQAVCATGPCTQLEQGGLSRVMSVTAILFRPRKGLPQEPVGCH